MKTQHIVIVALTLLLILPICLFADNKPDSGLLFEVGFAPFAFGVSGDEIDSGNDLYVQNHSILVDQIRVRYFLSSNMIFRGGINLDYATDTDKYEDSYYENNYYFWNSSGENNKNAYLIGLQGGIELHSAGTDKLSPFIGGIAGVNMHSAGMDGSDTYSGVYDGQPFTDKYKYEVTGGWANIDDYGNLDSISNRSYTNVLLKGIIGCDYYFAKNLYLGIELNYGLDYKSYPKVEYKGTGDNYSETDVLANEASSLSFGKTANSVLRLGFKF